MIRTILTAPQTKLREGNVFTSVSLSTGEGGYRWSYVLPSGWLCQGVGMATLVAMFMGMVTYPSRGKYVQGRVGSHPPPNHGIPKDTIGKRGGTYPSGMLSCSVLEPVRG